MRCATKNGTAQNWIESNNLRVWIREGGRGINKSSSDDRPGPCICDGGIEILTRQHQMPGRSWLAGESCGDGEPEGRDCPLEKGVGGIDSGARSVRVWDRVPMKNKTANEKQDRGR